MQNEDLTPEEIQEIRELLKEKRERERLEKEIQSKVDELMKKLGEALAPLAETALEDKAPPKSDISDPMQGYKPSLYAVYLPEGSYYMEDGKIVASTSHFDALKLNEEKCEGKGKVVKVSV